MVAKLKHKLVGAVARAPLFLRTLLSLSRPDRYIVLTYHRVLDGGNPFFSGIGTSEFRRQMEVVDEYFDVYALSDLVDRARSGEIPRNAVAITFDDGYRDNFTNAFPILKELSFPATIFLVTDALDRDCLIWHDRVFDGMDRTAMDGVDFESMSLPLTGEAERWAALGRVLPRLRLETPAARDALIDTLLDKLGVVTPPDKGWEKLRWDEVREMHEHGIRFGAHTLDHPILSRVDENEARRQIRDSKARIEEEVGSTVVEFAYPNGREADFTADTKRVLAEEGFRAAVTTVDGPNDMSSDPLTLRRLGFWGDDPYLSVLRLAQSRFAN